MNILNMKMHKNPLSLSVSVGLCLSLVLAGGALGSCRSCRKRTCVVFRDRGEKCVEFEFLAFVASVVVRAGQITCSIVLIVVRAGRYTLLSLLRNLVCSIVRRPVSDFLLRPTPRLLAPRSVSLLTPNTVFPHAMPQRCSPMTACSSPCATQWPAPSRTMR